MIPSSLYAISAGITRPYGHPDGDVVLDIIGNGKRAVWVNEDNGLSYDITIL
jgi:hypothetical protein